MEKFYTDIEYAQKAAEANKLGQKLYILDKKIDYEIAVSEWNYEEKQVQKILEDGTIEIETVKIKTTPIMEEITDETGEIIEIQKMHKETITKNVLELIIAPADYYICYKDNYTDGTINENFKNSAKKKFEKDFFAIPEIGYYRKTPKGYASAVESINAAFNAVTLLGKLPAGYLTFYSLPDFDDETQCNEQWLIDNSFKNKEMSAEEFGQFYAKFITSWNTQEHL